MALRVADKNKIKARSVIATDVAAGRMAHANLVPCVGCGHEWSAGDPRHEYDHHLGYAVENHREVESVCTTCHSRRRITRGEGVARLAAAEGVTPEEISDRLIREKKCSACNAWKPIDEFNKGSLRYDGLQSACRDCSRSMSASRRSCHG